MLAMAASLANRMSARSRLPESPPRLLLDDALLLPAVVGAPAAGAPPAPVVPAVPCANAAPLPKAAASAHAETNVLIEYLSMTTPFSARQRCAGLAPSRSPHPVAASMPAAPAQCGGCV